MPGISTDNTLRDPTKDEAAVSTACNLTQNVQLMNNQAIIGDILNSKEFKEVVEELGGLD